MIPLQNRILGPSKDSELLTHIPTRMNLRAIMLSERRQTKSTSCRISSI